jgi:hypothetical protein
VVVRRRAVVRFTGIGATAIGATVAVARTGACLVLIGTCVVGVTAARARVLRRRSVAVLPGAALKSNESYNE